MYKKYITKKGKKIGPYFYESIRTEEGKVKAVYLGRNEQVALQKLEALRQQHRIPEHSSENKSTALLPQKQPESRLDVLRQQIHHYEAQKQSLLQQYKLLKEQYTKQIISPELYQQKYYALFGHQGHNTILLHYDSEISRAEQELLRLRNREQPPTESTASRFPYLPLLLALLTFFGFFYLLQPSLTGLSFLFPEDQQIFTEELNIITNTSMTYTLNITPATPISTLTISGSYTDGGSVRIYLVNDNYLVYDSDRKESSILQKITETVSSLFSDITGLAIIEPTNEQFSVRNASWNEHPIQAFKEDTNLTLLINDSTLSLFFSDIEGSSLILSYQAQVLTPPEGWFFTKFSALNLTTLNFTEGTLTSIAEGIRLYRCSFWDFDLGLCLASWEEVLNLTQNTNYTVALSSATIAFAEALPSPPVQEESISAPPKILQENLTEPLILENQTLFLQQCVDTCSIINFTEQQYKLVIIISNTTLNLSSVTYTFTSFEGVQEQQQSFQQAPSPSLQELLQQKQRKITFSMENQTVRQHRLNQKPWTSPKGLIAEDNWEKRCDGGKCSQIIYSQDKYFIKDDGTIALLENALETQCDGLSEVCARGKKYRADFKHTPLEDDTISFQRDAQKIAFQPLQIRYVDGNREVVLSSANPVYGYGENNTYSYPFIFGHGTELRLIYEPNQLKEEIVFSDASLLQDNGIQDSAGYLLIDYLVNLSENLTLASSQGTILPETDVVYFLNSTSVDFYSENIAILPQPFVSSPDSMQLVDYALTQTTNGLIMSLRVPLVLVSRATYPVIVDPTIILNHTRIIFDGDVLLDRDSLCYERDGISATFRVGSSLVHTSNCGGSTNVRMRADIDWDIRSIPRNADIVDANLTLFIETESSTENNLEFYHMDGNSSIYPDDDTGNSPFYEDMRNGTNYLSEGVLSGNSNYYRDFNLTSVIFAQDFETILWNSQGWWSIGMTTEETDSDQPYTITSTEGTLSNAPTLMIQYELPAPAIYLNTPENQSVLNRLDQVVLNATIVDNEPYIEEVVYYASNKTFPDGDDIIYIERNATNGTAILVNWTAPVWEPDERTVLLAHFNNRSFYGEHDLFVVDYSNSSFNGTIVRNTANYGNLLFYNFTSYPQLGGGMHFSVVFGLVQDPPPSISVENVSFGTSNELIGSDYTWILRLQILNTSATGTLLTKYSGSNGLKIEQEFTNLIITANSNVINLSNFFVENEMTHLALTLDSSNDLRVYKNGTLFNLTNTNSGITDNSAPLDLLLVGLVTTIFEGVLDELIILNRTLSQHEIFRAHQLPPATYYWYVNATDVSDEPIGVNMSEIRMFQFNAVPYALLEAPENGSIVRRGNFTLNTSIFDDDAAFGDTAFLTVKIFGDNTSTPSGSHMLYYQENLDNGTQIVANWTVPVITNDSETQLLYHFDNNSLYGESSTFIYDFSASSNDGVPQQTTQVNFTNEILAGVYSFNGTGEHIVTDCQFACYQTRNATYMGWARTWTTAGAAGLAGASFGGLALGFGLGRSGANFLASGDGGAGPSAAGHLVAGEWFHFAVVTLENNTADIYFNGTFAATGQFTGITDVTAIYNFTIGILEPPSSTLAWNGDIDEFIIINRTLTSQEIFDSFRMKSDKYFWFVNVSDQYTENQSEIYEFRINSAPEIINGPTLTPTNANTTSVYTCTFTLIDDDEGDLIDYNGNFYNFSDIIGPGLNGIGNANGTTVQQPAGGDIQGKNDQNSCQVTPSDAYETGIIYISNTVTVLNSPPNPVALIAPEHLNQTFNRTPSFDYNTTTDPDNDELNYTLNLTCLSTAGGGCSGAGDDRLLNFTSNTSGLVQELQYFIDDNFFYNWTVLAFDGDNESDWADPPLSINISTFVDIVMISDRRVTDFGTMVVGTTNETICWGPIPPVDPQPPGLELENQGNVEIEVNLSENSTNSLFSSTPAPTDNYLFYVNAVSEGFGGIGVTISDNSTLNYTQIPRWDAAMNATAFKKFNHTDTNDRACVNINITVPQDEPAGYKESILEFIGYYRSDFA